MEPRRRRQLLLGVLASVILGVAIYLLWPGQSGSGATASNPRGAAGSGRQAGNTGSGLDVHLGALTAAKPTPAETERNLFRFKPKAPPPPPPPTEHRTNPAPPPPAGPA